MGADPVVAAPLFTVSAQRCSTKFNCDLEPGKNQSSVNKISCSKNFQTILCWAFGGCHLGSHPDCTLGAWNGELLAQLWRVAECLSLVKVG